MAPPRSDAAKIQQIITEFFAKSIHVILESRTTPCDPLEDSNSTRSPTSVSSQSSDVRLRDKWFNMALKECPSVYENLNAWCWSDPECMVIDVILIKRVSDLACREENGEWRRGKIIERWVVKHETTRTNQPESSSKENRPFSKRLRYQKSIVVLRSLYTTVRLLPAYRLFRKLSLSNNPCSCFLAHRVSAFPEPLDHKLEAEMQLHDFASLDTPCGKICLSVLYMSRVSELIHQTSSMSVAPTLVPGYMDSSLAEPVKNFPSLPKAPDYLPSKHNNSTNKCQASPASFGSSTSSVHSRDKTFLPGKNDCVKKKPVMTNLDEFGFSDINCVFDVVGNDPIDSATSESQVASAGILVDTLQKAQPLRSQLIPRKSVDDALRELQGYIQKSKSLNTRRAS